MGRRALIRSANGFADLETDSSRVGNAPGGALDQPAIGQYDVHSWSYRLDSSKEGHAAYPTWRQLMFHALV